MKQIVLVGAGHTHAYVLSRWRRSPIRGAQLTCVSQFPVATYSGMLPAALAGLVPPGAMQIDLVALCAAAGARLVVARAAGVDVAAQQLALEDGTTLPFDVLSVGVGSVPDSDAVDVEPTSMRVDVKPMQTFLERLSAVVTRSAPRGRPMHVAVVGGGAAGVELALCAPRHIASLTGESDARCLLVTAGRILDGSRAATAERARAALARRGVIVREHTRVAAVGSDHLAFTDGTSAPVDAAIWVTAAVAGPFLRQTDLPVDHRGFLRTTDTLQSVARVPVFAVGDAGTIDGVDSPKAGVHAVRQGPVLWSNLLRVVEGRTLRRYAPQRTFLKLLNIGDGAAIGEWRGWTFEGRAAGALKTWIDGRFVRRYRVPD